MSKKRADAQAFLTRSAKHSMTAYGTGRVEVRPKHAKDSMEAGTIIEQRNEVRRQIETLRNKQKAGRLTKRERLLFDKLRAILGNLNKTINLCSEEYEERKAWVFWRIANVKLKHDIFKELDKEAEAVMTFTLLKEE